MQHVLRRVAASFVFLAVFTVSVVAADDVTVEEIVVTADLRERSLDVVPVSISILDSRVIEQQSIQHFEELTYTVPNLNWSGDGHRARYFQIRGVGELE